MIIKSGKGEISLPYLTFKQLLDLDRTYNVLRIPELILKPSIPTDEEKILLKHILLEFSRITGTKNLELTQIPEILLHSLKIKDHYSDDKQSDAEARIPFHQIIANLLKAQIPPNSVMDLTLYDLFEIFYLTDEKKNESQASLEERMAEFNEKLDNPPST